MTVSQHACMKVYHENANQIEKDHQALLKAKYRKTPKTHMT